MQRFHWAHFSDSKFGLFQSYTIAVCFFSLSVNIQLQIDLISELEYQFVVLFLLLVLWIDVHSHNTYTAMACSGRHLYTRHCQTHVQRDGFGVRWRRLSWHGFNGRKELVQKTLSPCTAAYIRCICFFIAWFLRVSFVQCVESLATHIWTRRKEKRPEKMNFKIDKTPNDIDINQFNTIKLCAR